MDKNPFCTGTEWCLAEDDNNYTMYGSKLLSKQLFYLLQRRKHFKTPQKHSKTFKVKRKRREFISAPQNFIINSARSAKKDREKENCRHAKIFFSAAS